MRRPSQTTRMLAASTSFAAAFLTVSALPANADPAHEHGPWAAQAADGQARAAEARNQAAGRADKGADERPGVERAPSEKASSEKASSEKASSGEPDGPGADGSPPGNNGTVKVAPYGAVDTIPDNTPHAGCQFQIEWYGFDATDEGGEVVSTVEFAMHAPTSDAVLVTSGPSTVTLDGDEARGAGTETGQDAVQTYTLSVTGDPHPQQGYHVKLTVHTPYSYGNDTKSKVFWVQGCEQPAVAGTDTTTDVRVPGATVLGVQASAPGAAAVAPAAAPAVAAAAVPTAVAAGLDGVHRDARTAAGLALLLGAAGGLALTGAAARRRGTAVRR